MQIALHLGMHCTESERLVKALLRNASTLVKSGTSVPGPSRYRKLLSQTLEELGDACPAAGAREVLLDAIMPQDYEQMDRVILSHENLISSPRYVFDYGQPYSRTQQRLTAIQSLFPEDQFDLFVGLRNPASFLPAMVAKTETQSLSELTGGMDPANFRWTPMIKAMRTAMPRARITFWCYEDIPLIWGEIIRAVAGLPSGAKIAGAFDMLASVMEPEGMRRFRAYLSDKDGMSEKQKRRIMIAFLDKYAMDEELEEVLDLPGWTENDVEDMSDIYDEEVEELAQLPGVRWLAP